MRLTFTKKLYGVYFILIIAALASGFYSNYRLYLIAERLQTAIAEDLRRQEMLSTTHETFLLQSRVAIESWLRKDMGLMDLFNQRGQEFQTHLAKLKDSASTTSEVEIIQRLVPLHQEFTQSYATHFIDTPRANLLTKFILEGLENLRTLYEQDLRNHQLVLDAQVQRSREILLWLPVLLTLGAIIILHTLIVLSRRPLRQLREAIKNMIRGNLTQSIVQATTDDEIGDLTSAYNQLAWKLQRLDNLKEDFISNLSHELRTPLTSLQEATNLLLEEVSGALNERQRQLLLIIQDDTKRLLGLTTNLLELSRMRAGMLPLQIGPCSLEDLARETLEAFRPLAMKRDLHLELITEHRITEPILADKGRLRQVMVNLLSNAIKFTPPAGKVSIRIRKPSPREVEIGVADTGCGISKEDQDKIFDRFYTGGGFGLGLPITRQIVMAHGGKIWVESEPGKGSVFYFTLPWKIAKMDEKQTLVSTTVDHGNTLSDDPPGLHRLSHEQHFKASTD